MDDRQRTLPDAGAGINDAPRPDQPCAGRDSDCGHSCHLDDGSWTYETTMSIGGIDNDVQAYCLCEHHELDQQGTAPGLADHVRWRVEEAAHRE